MAECVFYNFDPYRSDRIRCKFCPQPDVVHDLAKSRYRRPCPRDMTPEELAERVATLSSRKPCVPCAEERRQRKEVANTKAITPTAAAATSPAYP